MLPDIKHSDLIIKSKDYYEILPHFCPQCGYLIHEDAGFYNGYNSALLSIKILELNGYRCFNCMMNNVKRWLGRWGKKFMQ